MPNVYGQNTKITDVVGRSRYISGESDKQEEVIVKMHIKKIKDRTRRGK